MKLVDRPIDDAARDGRFQAVLAAGRRPVVARHRGDGRWEYSNGRAIDFEPTHYLADADG